MTDDALNLNSRSPTVPAAPLRSRLSLDIRRTATRSLITLLLLTVASQICFAGDAATLELRCEKLWIIDSGAFGANESAPNNSLTRQWLAREGECGATSVYWGRLSILQMLSNDFPAAKASLARAPRSDNAPVVALARAQLAVRMRLADSKPISREEVAHFETLYREVARKHPKWPTAYAFLGGVQVLLGKHREAVSNLRVAQQGDAYELSGVYRNLTVSLSALREYRAAMEAADQAFERDRTLTGDAAFALAVAESNMQLGQLDDAEAALKLIAAKRPEVRHDPEFQRLSASYQAKRRAGR